MTRQIYIHGCIYNRCIDINIIDNSAINNTYLFME